MAFAAAKTMLFFRTFSSDWMRVVLGMADNSLGGSWNLPLGLGMYGGSVGEGDGGF